MTSVFMAMKSAFMCHTMADDFYEGSRMQEELAGMNATIRKIHAREILDSRGNPTVEVDVWLEGGAQGRASVPSGASTGKNEALEIRDGDAARYGGKGVLTAIRHITDIIAPALTGKDAANIITVDDAILALDPTPVKQQLGANATLGVSIAVARAAAVAKNLPLYRYLEKEAEPLLPVPMMNVMNGGVHARWQGADFQEYMIAPLGAPSFHEALRWGAETYHALQSVLKEKGYSTAVGDEGGFAPVVQSNAEPLELIMLAIKKAGYVPGTDIALALDPAASGFYREGRYDLKREGRALSSEEMIGYYDQLTAKYPIVAIEDGLAEDDEPGWKQMTARLGSRIEIIGDDIFVTSPRRILHGGAKSLANSALIKPNQIGTVYETLMAIRFARNNNWGILISHRSGETDDTFIADLAVATRAGKIKTGAPCRGERVAKYNRLLRIEEEIGGSAVYAGRNAFVRGTGKGIAGPA